LFYEANQCILFISSTWELKHSETFATRSAAMQREREIKARKSRRYIEELISHQAELAEPRERD